MLSQYSELQENGKPFMVTWEAEAKKQPGRRVLPTLTIGALLMSMSVIAVSLERKLPGSLLAKAVRITFDSGLTVQPAISKDGKLLAYASDRSGEGNLDLYLQLVGGGQASRLTHEAADVLTPAFSPDGVMIVFRSERDGGGIYVMRARGGEARRIVSGGRNPRFSPDGTQIAYWSGKVTDGPSGIYVIPASGGTPLPVLQQFHAARYPIWSPDGKYLLFVGTRQAQALEQEKDNWWIAPLDGAPAINAEGSGVFFGRKLNGSRPVEWTADNRVVFSAGNQETSGLWRVPLSAATLMIAGPAERITLGTDIESASSVASDGTLPVASVTRSTSVWSLPVDANQGKVSGEIERLTGEGAHDWYPSVSAAGDRLAFQSNRAGKWNVWMKRLDTGAESPLTSARTHEFYPRISPDGSKVVYWAADRNRNLSIYVVSVSGGSPSQVCTDCGEVQDWSMDGKKLLYVYGPAPTRIYLLDIDSQKKIELLKHPSEHLSSARFSPDGRWIVFQSTSSAGGKQIFIAPFRGEEAISKEEWIAVTDGSEIDTHGAWSPDGNILYFLSERDGHRCIWAQRLNPATKRPVKAPFAVQHFHSLRRSLMHVASGAAGLSVLRNQLILSVGEVTGNVYMARVNGQR